LGKLASYQGLSKNQFVFAKSVYVSLNDDSCTM